MTVEIRLATDDDLEPLMLLDFRNFGSLPEDGDLEEVGAELDLDRFLLAEEGGRLVGAAGSFEMDLTAPGGATLPVSGVTWVSVSATHRRRGILRRLMAGLDELAVSFGDPVLGLLASEGPIYERFGYGVATRYRVVEIDRRRTGIDPRWDPEAVELIVAQDHVDELLARFDRYRLTQPGEVSRSESRFRPSMLERDKPDYAALHPDGYAIYKIEPDWNRGAPAHALTVKDLVAASPAAHLALWHLLLSIDLVGPIRSIRAVAPDDPLPYLLSDPRALRTVELNDGLWLKVDDVARCFSARSYRVDDRLAVGVVEDVEDLAAGAQPVEVVEVGPGGCHPVDREPDLVASRPALGPLLLGADATALAAGRRLRADEATLERADLLLGTGRAAHCRTPF